MKTEPSSELRSQFGEIDIYLFDQLLRGRFDGRRRILDAGCGSGRNLPFLLTRGFEVFAIDEDPAAVRAVRRLAAELAPALPVNHVREGRLDALPWSDGQMPAAAVRPRSEAHNGIVRVRVGLCSLPTEASEGKRNTRREVRRWVSGLASAYPSSTCERSDGSGSTTHAPRAASQSPSRICRQDIEDRQGATALFVPFACP